MRALYAYIRCTWRNGRDFDFPVAFILKETVRGLFTHVNILTEI
tara:strand:- start:341 stop:472 length:132 start_codon:yes stop_codon:yes gene_type:complete